jgi:toxin ParE1/3/4
MLSYRLSASADRDLDGIYDYGLRRFGLEQTERYAQELTSIFQILADNPGIGRLEDKFSPPARRFEHGSHIILYDTHESHIVIVRVLHKAADVNIHVDIER